MTFKTLTTLGILALASPAWASTQEAATITTQDAQTLKGFWEIPDAAPVGAVVILQGSGNVAADGDVSSALLGSGYKGQPAKLSDQMADALAAAGIASLRYNKRGVDDPTQLPNQTLPFLKKDAESALSLVQSRFPNLNIGIVGLSEGATVATLVADEVSVKSLFLLSLPTRAIDDVLSYQFFGWPTNLMLSRFDPMKTGTIAGTQIQAVGLTALPLMGVAWTQLDTNHDGQLSESTELLPAYESFYGSMRGLLATPAFKDWYASYQVNPAFSQVAAQLKASSIYLYQGMDDAQINWSWVMEDSNFFPVKPTLHLYSGLGHCYSPMDGVIGEIKTSGPISNDVLQQLTLDVSAGLK